jgi:hypothetical protein
MAGKATVGEGDFLDSVASVGGSELAKAVRRAITVKNPNLSEL